MDHDQQITQLRDFSKEQKVDYTAASFATKSFLETLIDLINYSLQQQDDGTDSYKEELNILKDSIKAFSTVLPTVYKTICQNEAESRLWELAQSLISLVETQLVTHSNTGVQINAIKCLQVLVLLLSKSTAKDISLNLLRADHRLLNSEELEKKGQELFEKMMEKLKSDNESILTATISCLTLIGKRRTQFLKEIIKAFSSWKKDKDDSPVMLRNVNKALKLAFITMIRSESLAAFRPELLSAFGSIGGNVAMFQSRQSRDQESRRLKRQQQQQEIERQEREKRAKTEYAPIIPSASSPNILVNYDITQIPLPLLVNLCMTVLQTVPLEVMSERVSLLPPQGVTLAAARPGFVRSSTPPYPPPPDQPKYNTNPKYKTEEELVAKKEEKVMKIKREDPEDSDEDMDYNATPPPSSMNTITHFKEDKVKPEEKQKVEVLASVEERASQAFKMKPYELVKQHTELSDFEKKELLKMSIQRIFDAENMFQVNGNGNILTIGNGSATTTSSIWLLRMVKLITHGISQPPNPTEQPEEEAATEEDHKFDITTTSDDTQNELKDLLLEFIVGKLSIRTDLALEWLHEEYLVDKRQSESTANYFYWFHKFLKKGIPTLDAKDRVLTKLLLEAPELNAETIELVKENLYNVPQRFVPCVSTLRSLVTNRPAIRSLALGVLLDICINENDNMRRTGLVAVKKWDQADIHTKVEEFSVQALNVLTTPKDVDMDSTSEEEKDWTSKDVLRHAELYFVSCNKRPSLLKELFPVYIKSSEKVQEYLSIHMVNMIRSIGMKSLDLNKLLSEFPPGGESLVIKIISILCESKPPTREIISIVQTISQLAKERLIDVESLAPILEGHSLTTATTTTK